MKQLILLLVAILVGNLSFGQEMTKEQMQKNKKIKKTFEKRMDVELSKDVYLVKVLKQNVSAFPSNAATDYNEEKILSGKWYANSHYLIPVTEINDVEIDNYISTNDLVSDTVTITLISAWRDAVIPLKVQIVSIGKGKYFDVIKNQKRILPYDERKKKNNTYILS